MKEVNEKWIFRFLIKNLYLNDNEILYFNEFSLSFTKNIENFEVLGIT
jgi:hypothetical protein